MGKRLYVGNLPYDADEASLREAFGRDGKVVERVNIVIDRETQRPRGFAFVDMATEEQARQAIAALDGTRFGARQLRVTEAEDRRPPGPGGPMRGPAGVSRPPAGGFRGDSPRGEFPRGDASRPEVRRDDVRPPESRPPESRPPESRLPESRPPESRSLGMPRPVESGRAEGARRDDAMRPRFGPDAKPKHERMPPARKPAKRRLEGDGDEEFGGRRGSRRYDDDDDYE
jgi:RNA recognition motif-containing protein